MSLTRNIAHELRPVNTPVAQSVLPAWAKALPIGFYIGMFFFLGMWAYNNFRMNVYDAQQTELSRAISDAEEMIFRDKRTIDRLRKLHNTTVRLARWVDYTPMMQPMLKGVFLPLDDRVQVTRLRLDRRKSYRPEYTMEFVFRSEQSEADAVVTAVRDSLDKFNWQAVSNSQNYQEGSTDLQAFLQPSPSVRFESQSLALIQDGSDFNPEPSGSAQ